MALLEATLARSIIGGFVGVHNVLGFGLSERIYLLAMEQELNARGHQMIKEVEVPVFYRGALLQQQRLDMLVDERVVHSTKNP